MRRAAVFLALTVVVAAVGVNPSAATLPPIEVAEPAQPVAAAARLSTPADALSVSRNGGLSAPMLDELESVGAALGIPTAKGRSFNVGLHAVLRNGVVVEVAPGGGGVWQWPTSATALPVEAAGRVMSLGVAAVLATGGVVISATYAGRRSAQVGDAIDLIAADGGARRFVIGGVVPDAEIGGAELVTGPEVADALGVTRVTRLVFFGQFDRARLEVELAARGWVDASDGVRISRSWWPMSPDSTLSSQRTKSLLGEFAYRVNANGSLTITQEWRDANLQYVAYSPIPIRATCHRAIVPDLRAALDEVAAAGLGWAIDVGNTNTYGGCFNPRYAVVSGAVGSISRHAWAQAIDMNTTANAQGTTPRMDCRVVRIFRAHNFAWGGNFATPDGMHFEWVGERRDLIPYPSKYCPNEVTGTASSMSPSEVPTERDVMFAEDEGLSVGHHGEDHHHDHHHGHDEP